MEICQDGDLLADCSKGKKGKGQVSVEKAGGESGLKILVRVKGCGADGCRSMEDWKPEVEFWIGCTYERNWLRIKEWDIVFQNHKCEEMDRAIVHRHWCADLSKGMISSWYGMEKAWSIASASDEVLFFHWQDLPKEYASLASDTWSNAIPVSNFYY